MSVTFWNRLKFSLVVVVFAGNAWSYSFVQPRVIGGSDAEQDYSWMTAIESRNRNPERAIPFCGGVLIDSRWVLTAAHCVDSEFASALQVEIGESDISDDSGEFINVERIFIFENYQQNNDIDNDIALLKLTRSSNQTPIDLISAAEAANLRNGNPLTIMGWGITDANSRSGADILQVGEVPLAPDNECRDTWIEFDSDMICAGSSDGDVDTCLGDSGGPLLAEVGGTLKHIGIVSFGLEGCNGFGAYTKTASYLDWIEQTISGVAIFGDSNFGYLGVGMSDSATLEVINNSDELVTLTSIQLQGSNNANFSISDNNCVESLAPGASCEVTISVRPTSAGTSNSMELAITTDSVLSPSVNRDLELIALAKLDVDETIDSDELRWFTGGDAKWGNSGTSYTGDTSLRSGSIGDHESSVLLADVSAVSEVELKIKTSTEEGFDELFISLDGAQIRTISGENDWETYRFDIPDNAAKLELIYLKDFSAAEGNDAVWIDDTKGNKSSGGGAITWGILLLLITAFIRQKRTF